MIPIGMTLVLSGVAMQVLRSPSHLQWGKGGRLLLMTMVMLLAIAAVEVAVSMLISKHYITVAPEAIKLHVLDRLLDAKKNMP